MTFHSRLVELVLALVLTLVGESVEVADAGSNHAVRDNGARAEELAVEVRLERRRKRKGQGNIYC